MTFDYQYVKSDRLFQITENISIEKTCKCHPKTGGGRGGTAPKISKGKIRKYELFSCISVRKANFIFFKGNNAVRVSIKILALKKDPRQGVLPPGSPSSLCPPPTTTIYPGAAALALNEHKLKHIYTSVYRHDQEHHFGDTLSKFHPNRTFVMDFVWHFYSSMSKQ